VPLHLVLWFLSAVIQQLTNMPVYSSWHQTTPMDTIPHYQWHTHTQNLSLLECETILFRDVCWHYEGSVLLC
jgi:hypothetical protein